MTKAGGPTRRDERSVGRNGVGTTHRPRGTDGEVPAPRRIAFQWAAPGTHGPRNVEEPGHAVASDLRKITPSMSAGMDGRVRQLRRKGVHVLSFAAATRISTPEPITEAAIAAIREGFTQDTGPAGIPELR